MPSNGLWVGIASAWIAAGKERLVSSATLPTLLVVIHT